MPKASTPKLPPQNIEAEQSLLGALLIDKDAIVAQLSKLRIGLIYFGLGKWQRDKEIKKMKFKALYSDFVTLAELDAYTLSSSSLALPVKL